MDTIKRWESEVGALLWLADNPETAGEPYLLRAILDDNGKTTREVWAIRTDNGYVENEEVAPRTTPAFADTVD